ncbi:universal stress protein [Enterovirga aerilata]|uniref:Universal stress protein n=1 Tax=Enterovirga aerilata TaxID=2730920 RepID=A0A849IIL4_9HYPH|nr:universal stress protein [Enterovirga sp. DB1703]NNM73783.1 universal stress protein [Enterovirga sp. DB1703]
MIKDIVVVLGEEGERAGPIAISLAAAFDAALSGICVVPEAPLDTFAYAQVSYEMVASAREEAQEAAQAASGRFEDQARQAGLPVECSSICAALPLAAERLADAVRISDLIVIEQPDRERRRPSDTLLETVLLRSGRPALIVPYIQKGPMRFAQATVAWDGSPTAARALADALPLLRRADRVEVVNVVREGEEEEEQDFGPRLVRHLARHGVSAEFRRLPSAIPIADTILSHVADSGSDFLVMGAYGHSRIREALLGGTSRGILEAMTIPVLMSH